MRDHLLRHRAPDRQPGFDVAAEMDSCPEAREARFLRLRREVVGVTREEIPEHGGVSLSQLPNLRVIARTTAFRYNDQAADLSVIGRDLNVSAALTGKVLLRGDALIVQADLVNVADGAQLWGRQYTRKLSDIFSLQAEIATDIAEELRSKLTGEEKSLLAKRYTNDTRAYQLYQTGRFYWDKRTEDGFKKAIDYFRQATQRDQHYALAHTGLANTYIGLTFYNYLPPREAMPQAKTSAMKALKIDDTL